MATVPTFPAGQAITQANLTWWQATRPVMAASATVGQSIPTGAWTALTFTIPTLDRDGGATGNGYTVGSTTTAVYLVGAAVTFAASTAGTVRGLRLQLNSATVPGSQVMVPPGPGPVTVTLPPTPVVSWSAADVLTVQVFQDGGSSLSTTSKPVVTVDYAGSAGMLDDPATALHVVTQLPVVTTEIQFTPGVWTDVSVYVSPTDAIKLTGGRPDEYSDTPPGTMECVLLDDGRFMPGNTSGAYSPHIVDGLQVRQHITFGASSLALFYGTIGNGGWTPTFPLPGQQATTTLTAVDVLQQLAGITFIDWWTEELRARAREATSWCDIPALTSGQDAVNIGVTQTTLGGIATTGSYGSPSGLGLARSVTGHVTINPTAAPQSVTCWVQWNSGADTGTIGDRRIVLQATSLWYLALNMQTSSDAWLIVHDVVANTDTNVYASDVRDSAWRWITVTPAGGNTILSIYNSDGSTFLTYTIPYAMSGAASWSFNNSSTDQPMAGITVAGIGPMPISYATTPGTTTFTAAYTELQRYSAGVVTAPWAVNGSEDRTIQEPAWAGKTAGFVAQALATTVEGVLYGGGTGAITVATADRCWTTIPLVTIDAAADMAPDKLPALAQDVATRPASVTVIYGPAGGSSVTVTGSAGAEGGAKTVDTYATSSGEATAIGTARAYSTSAVRFSGVTTDVVSARDYLWPLAGMWPTRRIAISGINPAVFGAATAPVHVQGWTTEITASSLTYTISTSPGRSTAVGSWDAGDLYGRWASGVSTVTGGTAVGGTGTGTIIVTTSTGPGITTDPAAYPLYLAWESEVVQVTSPPSSGTSPQILTITARGAQSTTAVAHTTSTGIDLWQAAVFG